MLPSARRHLLDDGASVHYFLMFAPQQSEQLVVADCVAKRERHMLDAA